MNKFTTIFLTIILTLFFIGCGTNEDDEVIIPKPPTRDMQEVSSSVVGGDYDAPLMAPLKTSFADDLIFYNIASLDEKSSPIRKASSGEDTASEESDDGDEKSDDGEDKSDDDDDDGDDDGDDDSGDDSGDDDSGDDSSDDDSDNNTSDDTTSHTKNPQDEYKELGNIKVTLNTKDYDFSIAQDNYGVRIDQPSYTLNPEGTYSVSLTGYVIDNDEIEYDEGIFTLSFEIPDLNGSYTVLIDSSSNVLTNSSQQNLAVYARVTVSKDDNEFKMMLQSDDFYVEDKTQTRIYSAQFSFAFEIENDF